MAVADRRGEFTGKPRPGLIVQSDYFAETNTVTICPITSQNVAAPLVRFQIEPSATLPLKRACWIEVDMITAVRRSRIGPIIGRINNADLVRLNGALTIFLGIG